MLSIDALSVVDFLEPSPYVWLLPTVRCHVYFLNLVVFNENVLKLCSTQKIGFLIFTLFNTRYRFKYISIYILFYIDLHVLIIIVCIFHLYSYFQLKAEISARIIRKVQRLVAEEGRLNRI